MKYIVAARYLKREEIFNTRIFEFNSQKERSSFVKKIRPLVEDISLSQIDDDTK